MKERYNIEISDIQLTVVSDEPEEFVNSIVKNLNDRVNDLIVHNKRCSKLDAALLCALDYCGEYTKAEKRIKNLEEQIALYDARLKRMREEIASGAASNVKQALGVAAAAQTEAASEAEEEVAELEKLDAVDPGEAELEEVREALESLEDAAPAEEKPKRSKLDEIEFLLRSNS